MLDGCGDKRKEKKCRPGSGSDCENCHYRPATHEYVLHLFKLHLLGLGGFPFRANDLSMQTWEDLGRLRQAINAKMRAF